MFLGRDGGPREGAIRLPPEKLNIPPPIPEEEDSSSQVFEDEDEPRGLAQRLTKKISRRFSELFANRFPDIHHTSNGPSSSHPAMPLASTSGTRLDRTRTFSTSRTNGSAYGYSNNYRNRLASSATWNGRRASLHSSLRRRRGSAFDSVRDGVTDGSELNFAQRLLLANENAVTNIADLWVAAAMNVDNEDPFESDSETEQNDHFTEPISSVDVDSSTNLESIIPDGDVETDSIDASPSMASTPRPHRPSIAASFRPSSHRPSVSFSPAIRSAVPRRLSSGVPAIFSHPGVKAPPAILDAQQLLLSPVDTLQHDSLAPGGLDTLETISESPLAASTDLEALVSEKSPSLMSQLPIVVIIQYGVMALHTTTHDQIFMSYLVS